MAIAIGQLLTTISSLLTKKANDQRPMAKSGKIKRDSTCEPLLILVNQSIVFRAEAWEGGACTTADDWFAYVVATLSYNLVNIHCWSRIAQNCLLHNLKFYYIFVIARLREPWQSKKLMANGQWPMAKSPK